MEGRRIVEAAFAAWGDTHFTDTSLARVARALGVTKQALFRHFAGKAALLDAMEGQFSDDLHRVIDEFEGELPMVSFPRALGRYVELLFGFFRRHPYYYLYLTLHLAGFPGNQGEPFRGVRRRHAEVLDELLRRAGYRDPFVRGICGDFLSMSGFVWMGSCFWTEDGRMRETIGSGEQMEARRRLSTEIVTGGLFRDASRHVDFARLAAEATVGPEDLPPRGPVLNAIAEVVTSEGFEHATVEKIADRAGMSKSGLYFHFRNRAEMMARMLVPEHDRMVELVRERVLCYEDFSRRLYAFLILAGTYALRSRSILTALDWMRFHRIRMKLEETSHYRPTFAFLADGLRQEEYRRAGVTEVEVASYLNRLVMRPVVEEEARIRTRADVAERARVLYRLLVSGLEGYRNEDVPDTDRTGAGVRVGNRKEYTR
ncbi:MAG: TetR/AcrR family transcriptional regulator [Spirochaetaceae bacterium]